MKKRIVASVVSLSLAVLGGAGGGSASAAAAGKTVSVVDNAFQPRAIRVQKGSRVKWVHKGSNPHTVTANSGAWDESLSPGETFSRRFKKKGRFPYHCEIHSGMTGVVKVVA